jgi:uncharacterized protein
MTEANGFLDLPEYWVSQLAAIFSAWVPSFEVWAYGSRVTGQGHQASDLDLVLIHPETPDTKRCEHWFDIRQALDESNIPIRVDVMDCAAVPSDFHAQITKQKVRLFPASPLKGD